MHEVFLKLAPMNIILFKGSGSIPCSDYKNFVRITFTFVLFRWFTFYMLYAMFYVLAYILYILLLIRYGMVFKHVGVRIELHLYLSLIFPF